LKIKTEVIVIDEEDRSMPFQGCPSKDTPASKQYVSPSRRPSDTSQKSHLPKGLSSLEKWNLCTMWRKNKSLREISEGLGTEEAVLHSYLYELIKKDAMRRE
jgi:hypothetical protein